MARPHQMWVDRLVRVVGDRHQVVRLACPAMPAVDTHGPVDGEHLPPGPLVGAPYPMSTARRWTTSDPTPPGTCWWCVLRLPPDPVAYGLDVAAGIGSLSSAGDQLQLGGGQQHHVGRADLLGERLTALGSRTAADYPGGAVGHGCDAGDALPHGLRADGVLVEHQVAGLGALGYVSRLAGAWRASDENDAPRHLSTSQGVARLSDTGAMSVYGRKQRRPVWPAVLAAIALVVVGVTLGVLSLYVDDRSDSETLTPQDVRGIQASVAALPRCSEVFVPGEPIDDEAARAGCRDASGDVQIVGSFDCADGRRLWQVDASTGAPAGWGFSGEKYKASDDPANDPEYAKAYASCNS